MLQYGKRRKGTGWKNGMETSEIIIGNVCSLCAMVTDSISATRKKTNEMLGIQIISQFFYGAGSIILKGYSSTAQNVVAVLRNLAAIKQVKSKFIGWGLVVLSVVLGVAFNNRGVLGWLPIVANLQYSIVIFLCKDNGVALKLSYLVSLLMYAVFCYVILNYVGVAANLIVAVTTTVSLIRGKAGSGRDAAEDGSEKEKE